MAIELRDWIEEYRRAWESKDDEAVVSLFTPDGTYRSNIFEEPHAGHDGIGEYWRSVTSVQSGAQVRMGRPFVDGSRVAVEFWTNMKVDGDEVTLPGCLLLEFADDGLCVSLREYWHYQPGTFQPPAGWGE